MSEEKIPRLISDYRTMLLQNRARYIRLARFHLLVFELIVALTPLLLTVAFVAVILLVVLANSLVLFELLALACVLVIAIVRLRSFHTVFRNSLNVMVSQSRKPSFGGVVVLILIGVGFIVVVKALSTTNPALLSWAVVMLGVILFFVLRLHLLLKESFRFFTVSSLGQGIAVNDGVAANLLQEAMGVANSNAAGKHLKKLFLANSIDIGIGRIVSEESKVYRSSMVVGLPLLQAVTPEQFRALLRSEYALLAHPYGQLFHRYAGRLSARQGLFTNLDNKRHWGADLFLFLSKSILSRLTAHFFLLSRVAHQEGDAAVVKDGHLNPLRDALANLSYKHRIIENLVWPGLYRKADDTGATALDPFSVIHLELSREHDPEEAKLKLNEAMMPGENLPLIPGPSERLAMLNVTAHVPEEQSTAADHYFGANLADVIERVNQSWNRTFSDTWGETLIQRRQFREDLDMLIKEAEETSDSKKQSRLLLRAGQIREELLLEEGEWQEALELYRQAIFADPNSAAARLAAARLLLAHGEDEGLDLLRSVLESTDEVEPRVYAYEISESYLRQKGMDDEAKRFEEEHAEASHDARKELNAEQRAAEIERGSLNPSDVLLPHELSERDVCALCRVLKRYPRVREAWLVRKEVKHFVEYPFYVLGVELTRPWSWSLMDPGEEIFYAQRIAEELSFLQGGLVVLLLSGENQISSVVRNAPDAHVYTGG